MWAYWWHRGGAIRAALASLTQTGLMAVLALGIGSGTEASTVQLFDAINRADVVKLVALGVLVAALTTAGSDTQAAPAWLSWAGWVLAVLLPVSGLAFVVESTILYTALSVSLPLLLIWVAAFTTVTARRLRGCLMAAATSLLSPTGSAWPDSRFWATPVTARTAVTAHSLAVRVYRAGIVACVNHAEPSLSEGLNRDGLRLKSLARDRPNLARAVLAATMSFPAHLAPDWLNRQVDQALDHTDRAAFRNEAVRHGFTANLREAFRSGTRGVQHDYVLDDV